MPRRDFWGNSIRIAGLAGLLAPVLFAAALVLLSLVQYDFMRSLGWDPLGAPSFDWPSGLALGRYGAWMTGTFLLGGGATLFFADGLRRALKEEVGAGLLALAGLAMAGLAFTTDPTLRTTPATWHGRLHDLSFVLLGLTLVPAMVSLGRAFGRAADWRDLALYSWITAALSILALVFRGVTFYVFLLAVLAWYEVVAWRLTTAAE